MCKTNFFKKELKKKYREKVQSLHPHQSKMSKMTLHVKTSTPNSQRVQEKSINSQYKATFKFLKIDE